MCEYCKGNKCLKGNEDESYYKIENNILIHEENCIDSFYSYTDEINIYYCPMCGRKLG